MSRESKATKEEIQRNRDEAYQNGWSDGYAEGIARRPPPFSPRLTQSPRGRQVMTNVTALIILIFGLLVGFIGGIAIMVM